MGHRHAKVYYSPLEAAIRWSGLQRHETEIHAALEGRPPPPDDFPQWPNLQFNLERIYDAITHGELYCVTEGVRRMAQAPLDPDLTLRHVDLKRWMKRYYPEEKPRFLFSRVERNAYPLPLQMVQALVYPRDQTIPPRPAPGELSRRGEATYLHIVGGLLGLLLGKSTSGQPYSSFRTQESIISAMVAHGGEHLGISERTLAAKFAAAKRELGGF